MEPTRSAASRPSTTTSAARCTTSCAAAGPVTRAEAAAAVGVSRKLAAFHLDRLVDADLLRASTGRAGSAAWGGRRRCTSRPRPSSRCHCRRASPDCSPRSLAAVARDGAAGERPRCGRAVSHASTGCAVGAAERERARPGRLGSERALRAGRGRARTTRLRARAGRPPAPRLRNCPFHPLAALAPARCAASTGPSSTGIVDGLEAPGHGGLDPRAASAALTARSWQSRLLRAPY